MLDNRERSFIFIKDMPFGDGKILQNTRLNVHKGMIFMDGMMLTSNAQNEFINLIENEINKPNYLKEILIK